MPEALSLPHRESTYLDDARCELTDVCDTDPAALAAPVVRTGARGHASLSEMLAATQAALRSRGVPSATHYPKPLHQQPEYRQYGADQAFATSVNASRRVLSLPMSADLLAVDQEAVIRHLRESCERAVNE